MIIVILLPLHRRHCLLGPFSLPPVFLSSAMCEAHITSAQIVSTGKSNHLIQSCWKCSRGFPLPVRKKSSYVIETHRALQNTTVFPLPGFSVAAAQMHSLLTPKALFSAGNVLAVPSIWDELPSALPAWHGCTYSSGLSSKASVLPSFQPCFLPHPHSSRIVSMLH